MRIASWNVNSIKQRLDHLLRWLAAEQPDVVRLQETKCVDEAFPREPIQALGYNVAVHGQKDFNGVAILSKLPLDDVTPGLPGGDGDDHARVVAAPLPHNRGQHRSRAASLHAFQGLSRLLRFASRRTAVECAGSGLKAWLKEPEKKLR